MLKSNVPPPRSKTATCLSFCWRPNPYASAAEVGSLMMRTTSSPAILPASLVAFRWLSLKYAGQVITAFETGSPKKASASSRSSVSTIALISGGEYCVSPSWMRMSSCGPATTVYGIRGNTSCSAFEDQRRPISRLTATTVRSALVTACRRVSAPTSRLPLRAIATTECVIR